MHDSPQITPDKQDALLGSTLDASWPQIPVAHLSYETDTYFCTIHCLNA